MNDNLSLEMLNFVRPLGMLNPFHIEMSCLQNLQKFWLYNPIFFGSKMAYF